MTVEPLTDSERRCKIVGADEMKALIAKWLIDNANGRRTDFYVSSDAGAAALRSAGECILRGGGPPAPAGGADGSA